MVIGLLRRRLVPRRSYNAQSHRMFAIDIVESTENLPRRQSDARLRTAAEAIVRDARVDRRPS